MKPMKTREEAQDHVNVLDSETYHLAHGEYARPDYKALKVTDKELYYIHAARYYYLGTFYPLKDGPLD